MIGGLAQAELEEMQREQMEYASGKGFLRVGDIVMLYYDEKVYDELAGGNGGELEDPDMSDDVAREKAAKSDNLKARITQKPDLEYKGIVFCKLLIIHTLA